MRYPKWRSLYLSCILGVTAGSGLLPLSPALVIVQASELGSQNPQDGVIKTCTGQRIDLGAPHLTDADLKVLTRCSSGVMPQLLEALKAQNWKVKVIAAHTLGLFGTKAQSAIPTLSNLIQDENADIRFAAAQVLGEIGTETVVPALTTALQDKDENVRVSAAIAFQKIGSAAKQAKPELIAALWDGNWFVRSRAAETVSKLGLELDDIPAVVEPLRDNPQPDNGAIVALMLSIYPPIFNRLEDLSLFFIKGLQSQESKVRESAAIALGQVSLTRPGFVHLRESIYALQKAAEDPELKVRMSALKMLDKIAIDSASGTYGRKKDTQAISNIESLFLKSLYDQEPEIRQIALEALDNGYRYNTDVSPNSKLSTVILAALEATQDENPDVRQSAFDLLNSNLDKLDSLPSLLKPQFLKKVPLALTRSVYDKDASVRQNTWSSLEEKLLVPTLIEILQQKNIDPEIRHDAIAAIAIGRQYLGPINLEQSQPLVELLKEALNDPDVRIRVNAAHALERTEKISPKDAVSIFIEGLESEDPSAKLHAIFALNKMCGRGEDSTPRCAEAKRALPLLIDTLKANIKPLQYAAALAIADIDPIEESGINILGEILLEETDYGLRETTIDALSKIGSPNALSVMTRSLGFDAKQALYYRTCLYYPYMPTGQDNSPHSFIKRTTLLLKALENPDVRLLSAETFQYPFVYGSKPSLLETKFAVSELNSILKNNSNQYKESSILKNIFRLKGQDIRRSAIYSLGNIKIGLQGGVLEHDYRIYNFLQSEPNLYAQIQRVILNILTALVADQKEDLDIRWMAAAKLQQSNITMDEFFSQEKLIHPTIALNQSRWIGAMELKEIPNYDISYLSSRYKLVNPVTIRLHSRYLLKQYGFISGRGGISGLDFDVYLKQYIHDDRLGCGSGLGEIYNTLQRLFNGRKK